MPSIETRALANGDLRYFIRVHDPRHRPGRKTDWTSATFATEPEADRFVRDVADRGILWALEEYDREQGIEDEYTLDQWAAIHFKSLTDPNADTVERYRRIYTHDWSPHLGHLHLSQIDRVTVSAAVNQLAGSDKTRKNKWAVLTHMLKMAAQDGLIPRSPTIGIKLGRRTDHETEEHRYLTRAEFWSVLDATPAYWRPLMMLLAGSGMRWSELAALTVGDVDPEACAVRVVKSTARDGITDQPTKTKRGRRTIVLPAEVLDALEPLMEGKKRGDRLFLPPKGGPLRHRTFYRDIWLKKSVANAGIREPFPRLHDLRHSHVAWLIAAGVSLPVIQARLGHEKITTTIDTYGHLLPDVQRAAADAASLVLGARPPLLSTNPQT